MENRGWYIVTYDIADQRRLTAVHRALKNKGLALQRSVFLLESTHTRITAILNTVADLLNRHQDELRAYPVQHPSEIWSNTPLPFASPLIVWADKPCPRTRFGKR